MRITNRRQVRVRSSSSRLELSDFSPSINSRIDESVLPVRNAAATYNYRTDGKALTGCVGFKRLCTPDLDVELKTLPTYPLAIWHFRKYNFNHGYLDDIIMAYCADKYVYYKRFNDITTSYNVLNLRFEYTPSLVNYRYNGTDVVILCGQREGMVIWDGENAPISYPDMLPAGSMAVHYERLFVAEMGSCNRVWFSKDLDPLNFNVSSVDGGFIDFVDERGEVIKVLSFLDYLYVFREFGITRLTAYGDQSQFAVTQLFTGTGKIYKDTITVCGDVIYFLASDGLYVFDGLSARKTCRQFDNLWGDNTHARAAFHGGKLYLSCKLNYNDGKTVCGMSDASTRNTLIELDIRGGETTIIRGLNVCAITSCRSNFINKLVLGVTNTGMEKYLYEPNGLTGKLGTMVLPKYWRSAKSDFGRPDREKIFRYVSLTAKHDCVLTVTTERGERRIVISGSDEVQRFRLDLRGRSAVVELACDNAEAHIARPVFEMTMI